MKDSKAVRRLAAQMGPELGTCMVLCLAILAGYYPGLMTNDSNIQFEAVQTGIFSDFHSPIMTLVWKGFNNVYFGPFPMMFFHSVMYFAGLLLLVTSGSIPRLYRLLLILIITLWPAVLTQLSLIWKDVALSTAFLLACGCLSWTTRSRWFALPAVMALFYGASARENSWPALLPLAVWLGVSLFPHKKVFWTWGVFPWMFCLSLYLLNAGVKACVIQTSNHFGQVILIHDLAGISVRSRELLLPSSFLHAGVGLPQLDEAYAPGNADPLRGKIVLTRHPDSLAGLRRAWMGAITSHRYLYWRHRWAGFKRATGLVPEPAYYPYENHMWPNPWGFEFYPSAPVRMLNHLFELFRNSVIFRGWFYLFLCSILMGYAMYRRAGVGPAAVALSGVFYGIPYFFCGVALDFRYFYWTVFAVWVWILLMASQHWSAERNRTRGVGILR